MLGVLDAARSTRPSKKDAATTPSRATARGIASWMRFTRSAGGADDVRGCRCDAAAGRPRSRTYSGQRQRNRCHRGSFMQVSAMWRHREDRSVKPSAQPTLVRTQHLPPPAKTARDRGILRPRGPSCAVSSCVIAGQETSLYHDGYGRIADGFGPEQAVRRTACSGVLLVHSALSAAARQPGTHR
jgi:hypothetical protein